jgi:hypothetical protein
LAERPNDIVRRSKRESIPSVIQFPSDLGAHSMLMIFNSYKYETPGTRALNKVNASTFTSRELINKSAILLPLPTNIQDTYALRVQGFDQEISGAAIAGGAAAFAGAGDIGTPELISSLTAALPSVNWNQIFSPSVSDISRNIAFAGRRTIDSVLLGAGRNIDVGLGNIINPKSAIQFDGMNLKIHDFSWNLAPTSFAESETLRDMADVIRRNALPTYGTVVGLNRGLLNYPSTVDIFFLGIEQQYFMYFKTCMIQQFSFNFTPQGLAFVKGGKPAMVNLNINMMEMDIHTAEDYGGSSTINQTAEEMRVENVLSARASGASIGF